ncbi:MAG: ECF transporter S component [Desulfosarcinaceae bacterium]|nr:ECF transporter S component [Desulfosarcinaceae bacterium]
MEKASEIKSLFRVGVVAAFATLAFVGTLVIRVPLPVTGGYFNLGDTFVMAAGLLYGPLVGALVGMIGPALADAVGFPQFILATAVVKFCEGGLVGLIGHTPAGAAGSQRPLIAVLLGVLVLVSGYFVFEALIYPLMARSIPFFAVTDLKAAIAEIVPNLLQGGISAAVALGILRVFRRPH